MAQASKTFRIFVSSTFSDLKAERNALQQEVFPKLRELCQQHGCRFQAIDLRWGVSEEAAIDQQTMKICLTEIERCRKTTPRPNFIVLLGERYGWRPLPAEIPADEFERIAQHVSQPEERNLLVWDEQLQKGWYRRDDNAVPPVYCLQPREVELSDEQTDEEKKAARQVEADRWSEIERQLRRILLTAIDKAAFKDEVKWKYLASATEQEIAAGALRIDDAREHVFCFFRQFKQLPQGENAREFVDFEAEQNPSEKGKLDAEARQRLAKLKADLRRRLPDNIKDYDAEWNGSGITTDHLAKLCEDVRQSLSDIILKEIKQLEEVDPLEKESEDHESFGEERAKFFTGRASILQTISDYVKGIDPHPLAVFGASGSGKTALLAQAMADCGRQNAERVIVSRFIGATPASSDGWALLESLSQEISRRYGADEDSVSLWSSSSTRSWDSAGMLATADKPLIVFIDALDQLSDFEDARNLIWLPRDLPTYVRLIVSTLDSSECLTKLEKKLPAANLVELEPMPKEEGSELLDLWLAEAGRTLRSNQRAEVLDKFAANGLLLYLKLAFEEARRWKSYSQPMRLGTDIPSVVRELFQRLSADHGHMLVSHSLGCLAAAKNGLSEEELLDVLSRSYTVFKEFLRRARHRPPTRQLPVIVWSRLYFDLQAYLTERNLDGANLLAFYHRQLSEVVTEDYLADKNREHHRGLARYFGDQPLQTKKVRKKTSNIRKLSELPYQQTQGEMWSDLERTLTDFSFLEEKCRAMTVFSVLRDFLESLAKMPHEDPRRENITVLYRAIDADSHALRLDQTLLVQQMYNALAGGWDKTTVLGHAVHTGAEHYTRKCWLKRRNRTVANTAPALLRTLQMYGRVYSVAFSPDGKTVAGGSDAHEHGGQVTLWDVQTGEEKLRLTAHSDLFEAYKYRGVFSVAFSPDGSMVAGGGGMVSLDGESVDDEVKVWDTETGELKETLTANYHKWVEWVSFSPDGKVIAGTSGEVFSQPPDGQLIATVRINPNDKLMYKATSPGYSGNLSADSLAEGTGYSGKTVKLWDAQTGKLLRSLTGHTAEVTSVAFSPDGKTVASGGEDQTVRLWNAQTGELQRTLIGHSDYVKSVAFSPDGKIVASGGLDGTVRLWDTKVQELNWTSARHSDQMCSATFSPDGKIVASGGRDKTVIFWDAQTGQSLRTLSGHSDGIRALAFSPNGKTLASGSDDKTVRIWSVRSGRLLRTQGRHRVGVRLLAFSPDGRTLATTSQNGTVKLWHTQRWRLKKLRRTLRGPIYSMSLGDFILDFINAIINSERVPTRIPIRVRQETSSVTSTAFSPDGTTLAVGEWGGRVEVYNLRTGEAQRELEGYEYHRYPHRITSVTFSPDGETLASSSGAIAECEMIFWNTQTWEQDGRLRLAGKTTVTAFSPDGKMLASGSKGGMVELYDAQSRKLLTWLPCGNEVLALWFSSDSRELRVTDAGGSAGVPNIYVLEIVGPQP